MSGLGIELKTSVQQSELFTTTLLRWTTLIPNPKSGSNTFLSHEIDTFRAMHSELQNER